MHRCGGGEQGSRHPRSLRWSARTTPWARSIRRHATDDIGQHRVDDACDKVACKVDRGVDDAVGNGLCELRVSTSPVDRNGKVIEALHQTATRLSRDGDTEGRAVNVL